MEVRLETGIEVDGTPGTQRVWEEGLVGRRDVAVVLNNSSSI